VPFVLVDLAGLGLALLCLLAAIALDYIIKAIASVLPNLSILGVGLNLANIFRSAADSAVSWMVDNTKQFWNDVANWVNGHAYLFTNAVTAIVGAVQHLGDQIAHLYTTVIPDAISTAEKSAKKYADDLISGVEKDIKTAGDAAGAALSAADRAIYSDIASTESTIKTDLLKAISSSVDAAEKIAKDGLADLRTYVDASVKTAEAAATKAVNDLSRQVGTAIAGVASTAASDLAAAENTISGEISTVAQTAAADLSSTASTLTSEITSTGQSAAQALAGAESSLESDISTTAGTLSGDIATSAGQLYGDITSEAQTFAGDLTSLQGVLTAAIAAAVAGVVARVAELEECAVTTCDGPNNLSGLLNTLLNVGEFAAVFAFLSQIVSDPAGAEAQYSGLIGGLYGEGHDLFDQLLSL
jgi:hypothetical protein